MTKLQFFSQVGKYVFALFLVLLSVWGQSQTRTEIRERDYQNESVAMADQFREDGKIYVVVAVILTIFVGITVFLLITERKVQRLEKMVSELKQPKSL